MAPPCQRGRSLRMRRWVPQQQQTKTATTTPPSPISLSSHPSPSPPHRPHTKHCLVRALQLSGEASPAAWANLGILYARAGEIKLKKKLKKKKGGKGKKRAAHRGARVGRAVVSSGAGRPGGARPPSPPQPTTHTKRQPHIPILLLHQPPSVALRHPIPSLTNLHHPAVSRVLQGGRIWPGRRCGGCSSCSRTP